MAKLVSAKFVQSQFLSRKFKTSHSLYLCLEHQLTSFLVLGPYSSFCLFWLYDVTIVEKIRSYASKFNGESFAKLVIMTGI